MNLDHVELHLRLARRHVTEAEERLGLQQARVKTLAAGNPTEDSLDTAVRLLHLYQKALLVMQQHLATEEEFVAFLFKRRIERQGNLIVSDDKTTRGQQDRSRISLEQRYERRDWAKRLGVTEEELTSAVHAVGRSADKVKEYLSRRKRPSRS